MADEFRNDIVDVSYVAGEQPTHTKLETSADQLRLAIQRLGTAVGDVLSQQTHLSSSGAYDLAELKTVGPNLNRVIGSTGWLNPGIFGRTLVTRSVTFTGHQSAYSDPPYVQGFPHYNRRQFILPFPPIVFTSNEGEIPITSVASWTLDSSYWTITGTTAPNDPPTRVTNLDDLDAAGEYHISSDGLITLYTPLDSGESITIDYKFHPIPDAYDGASLNVIPDFAETSTLCTVAVVSPGIYSVDLPNYTAMRSRTNLAGWTNPAREYITYDNWVAGYLPNYYQQLLLPVALRDNLSVGDTIPDGYVRLWDNTSSSIVEGLEFTYQGTSTVNCTGTTLVAGSNRYRLIVAGANLAATVYSLRERLYWHNHNGQVSNTSGLYMGHRIHHYDLLNLTDEGNGDSDTLGFPVSELGPVRNPHPQYFHRYGWLYNDGVTDNDGLGNAFLGHLVISDGTGGLGDSVSSFGIYLSDGPGSPNNTFNISYSQPSNQVKIFGRDIDINQDVYLDSEIYYSTRKEKTLLLSVADAIYNSSNWSITSIGAITGDSTIGNAALFVPIHLPYSARIKGFRAKVYSKGAGTITVGVFEHETNLGTSTSSPDGIAQVIPAVTSTLTNSYETLSNSIPSPYYSIIEGKGYFARVVMTAISVQFVSIEVQYDVQIAGAGIH